ncbi:hypothetical protein [Pantoea sp. C2G6]|uniref:hypothetical protein n=1 Tax=Pantoea sp. C2G6 TaxID=3243084 RepID=UPI003EDAC5A9
MRKGIRILLCILIFSANSYAEDKMICYVPKKPVPKPTAPIKPVKKETKETSSVSDSSSVSSELTTQSTQVLINYPQNIREDKKNTENIEPNYYELTKGLASFFIKLLTISIWPLLIFIALQKFQYDIKKLMGRIKSGNVAGFGFEFHDIAEKYEDVAGQVTRDQEIKSNLDPRGAIISAWLNIETRLYQLFEVNREKVMTSGIVGSMNSMDSINKRPPVFQIIRFLKDKKLLRVNEVEILDDLRRMRNRVAHEADLELTQEDVTKYLVLANLAEVSLEKIENQVL